MTKIGIVEDSKTTREGLATIIDLSPDYRCVCVCDTAEKALAMLPKHAPEVVLMDIQLPGMSGIDCAARLKKLLPDVQIIMVTVYEDPDRIFSALRNGASGYLLKRSAPEQVLTAIRDVQQGGAPMSGEIARKVILHFRDQSTVAEEVENLSAREREVLDTWQTASSTRKSPTASASRSRREMASQADLREAPRPLAHRGRAEVEGAEVNRPAAPQRLLPSMFDVRLSSSLPSRLREQFHPHLGFRWHARLSPGHVVGSTGRYRG